MTKLADSVGGTLTRSFDSVDRLLSETTPQGTVSYTYDAAGRRLSMQAGNEAQIAYAYDNANRLTSITQGATSVSYAYDAASQLTAITYASGATTLGTLTYGYDLAGRVNARGGASVRRLIPGETAVGASFARRIPSRQLAFT